MGTFVFGIENACYALLCIYGITKVADTIAEGPGVSRLFLVISSRGEEIAEMVLHDKKRGVTKIVAYGGYTGRQIPMFLCVVFKEGNAGYEGDRERERSACLCCDHGCKGNSGRRICEKYTMSVKKKT